MKYLRLFLVLLTFASAMVRAQDEENRKPPTEIPDFSNLDEFIYEPKSILTLGMRHLSSARASFSGGGSIFSTLDEPGPATGANLLRHYHDGTLQPDARFAARTDNSGNPVIDPTAGGQIFDPLASDGKTNTWAYSDSRQITEDGFLVYHAYRAEVNDPAIREKETVAASGLDLSVSRDMGKVFGTRLSWQLIAGVSLSDISADMMGNVQATVATDADYYSLFGQTPAAPPYASPSSKNITIVDASGSPILSDAGVPQTVLSDTSVLIANAPAARITTLVTDETSVVNRWKLKGAFLTFRVGPTLVIPIFSRLQMSLTAGFALIYAGTNYTVTQTLDPETGTDITDTATDAAYKLLPGYFADATLQFNVTDRTGFYAGALYQSAGSYGQELNNNSTARYSTKVDFGNQNGLRAGLAYRF